MRRSKPDPTHPPTPPTVGSAVGGAIDATFGTVGQVGRLLLTPLRLPGLRRGPSPVRRPAPGAPPGLDSIPDLTTPPPPGAIRIQCIDYGPDRVEIRDIEDLDALLAEDRPAWAKVRWINVDGLHPYIVNRFVQSCGIHTLAAEDMLHIPQRPKLDPFDDDLFLTTRMLMLHEGRLVAEQVSLFYRAGLLLSFQERAGDVWQPIRNRLQTPRSRFRNQDGSYLLYALLDAIVDHCFPILEHYGDLLEDLEVRAVGSPSPQTLQELHGIKRQLVQLRRVLWPMREVIAGLQNPDLRHISRTTRLYLRDVHDHVVQVLDIIETYREMAGGLMDLYMSAISNRTNQVMKVLTIMASVFIPLTFFVGVYGMNFEHFPELQWRWMYPEGFWIICLTLAGALLYWFHRKGWLGSE